MPPGRSPGRGQNSGAYSRKQLAVPIRARRLSYVYSGAGRWVDWPQNPANTAFYWVCRPRWAGVAHCRHAEIVDKLCSLAPRGTSHRPRCSAAARIGPRSAVVFMDACSLVMFLVFGFTHLIPQAILSLRQNNLSLFHSLNKLTSTYLSTVSK